MKFGLSKEEYQEIETKLVHPLEQAGAKVWIFGSRARGDSKPFSDLDIMVESPKDLRDEVAALKEYFENSNFPFKIDLVEKHHFATSYLPNFEKEKILWQ